jgi:tripartite-type tricarboxylate transporter receptor subunit TctC
MKISIAFAALLVVSGTSLAQTGAYPTKPIRWLVPFQPGGGTDVIARPVAQKLGERLGQQIIYENRGGAGGLIAGEIVAKAAPDGYTMLVAAVAVSTVMVSLVDKMPFDPIRDFAPITKFAAVPNVLAARAAFAPRTVKELVDFATKNPDKVTWASSGPGSNGTLTMELFRMNTGIKVVHVPYKGAGPATVALLSNEADLLFANPGVFMPHIKAGRLRGLAVASSKRVSMLPDIPTFSESGFAGYESASWYGLAAPARTPATVIKRIHAETVKVLADPEILAAFSRDGAQAVGNTPQAFAQEIREDIAKWAKVIKAANIKM